MTWIGWIVVGVIAGLIARALMPGEVGGGLLTDLIVGVVGALLGGWIFSSFLGKSEPNGINLYSIGVSIVGAVIFLGFIRLFSGRRVVTS